MAVTAAAWRRLQNEQVQRAASDSPFGKVAVIEHVPQWQVAVIEHVPQWQVAVISSFICVSLLVGNWAQRRLLRGVEGVHG